MQKLSGESQNTVAENIEKLKALFPDAAGIKYPDCRHGNHCLQLKEMKMAKITKEFPDFENIEDLVKHAKGISDRLGVPVEIYKADGLPGAVNVRFDGDAPFVFETHLQLSYFLDGWVSAKRHSKIKKER